MATVRVKRPNDVALFLRDFPAEVRHALSNDLMRLGLQQLQLDVPGLDGKATHSEGRSPSSKARRQDVAAAARRRIQACQPPQRQVEHSSTTNELIRHHNGDDGVIDCLGRGRRRVTDADALPRVNREQAQQQQGSYAHQPDVRRPSAGSARHTVFGQLVDYQSPARSSAEIAEAPAGRPNTALGRKRVSSPHERRAGRGKEGDAHQLAWFCTLDGAPQTTIPAAQPTRCGRQRVDAFARDAEAHSDVVWGAHSRRAAPIREDDLAGCTTSTMAATSEEANLLSPSTRTPEESPKAQQSAFSRVWNGPGAPNTNAAGTLEACQQGRGHCDIPLEVGGGPVVLNGSGSTPVLPRDTAQPLVDLVDQVGFSAHSIESGSTTRVHSQSSPSPSLAGSRQQQQRQPKLAALDAVFACAGLKLIGASGSRPSSMQTTPSIQPVLTVASSPFTEHSPQGALAEFTGAAGFTARRCSPAQLDPPTVDAKLRYLIEKTRGARLPAATAITEIGLDPWFRPCDIVRRYGELLVEFHIGHARDGTL